MRSARPSSRHLGWLASFFALLIGTACATGCNDEPQPVVRMELFWDMVKEQLPPTMPPKEKALTLTRWIVANSTNDHQTKDIFGVPFYGPCDHRTTVFELLGERAGLTVRRVPIDNFNGSGHTSAEVFYDDAWHYLDVTYAGYFEVDGRILSFAEMQSDPEAAIAGMVVIEGTLDRWSDGQPVSNQERMRINYTPEGLTGARVIETAVDAG